MSTHDEDRLARGLRERAQDVHGAPVGLADVQRSARGIRRRRRAVGGVVAAVVLAVAVPVGLNAVSSAPRRPARWPPRRRRRRCPPTPRRDARQPSPSRPPGEPVPLTVAGAPTGAAAGADLPARHDGASSPAPTRSSCRRRTTRWRRTAAGGWPSQRTAGHAVRRPPRRLGTGAQQQAGRRPDRGQPGRRRGHRGPRATGCTSTPPTGTASSRGRSRCPQGASSSPVGFVGPGSVLARVDGPEDDYWVTSFEDFQVVRGPAVGAGHRRVARRARGADVVQQPGPAPRAGRCGPTAAGTGSRRPATGRSSGSAPTGRTSRATPRASTGSARRRWPCSTRPPRSRSSPSSGRATATTFVADVAWEDETHALATLHEDGPVVPRPARPRRVAGAARRGVRGRRGEPVPLRRPSP